MIVLPHSSLRVWSSDDKRTAVITLSVEKKVSEIELDLKGGLKLRFDTERCAWVLAA
jgi:hypothetical protein